MDEIELALMLVFAWLVVVVRADAIMYVTVKGGSELFFINSLVCVCLCVWLRAWMRSHENSHQTSNTKTNDLYECSAMPESGYASNRTRLPSNRYKTCERISIGDWSCSLNSSSVRFEMGKRNIFILIAFQSTLLCIIQNGMTWTSAALLFFFLFSMRWFFSHRNLRSHRTWNISELIIFLYDTSHGCC